EARLGECEGPLEAKARVLILAADDGQVAPLAEGLDALGWRSVTARTLDAAAHAVSDLAIEAVVTDPAGQSGSEVAPRLRQAAGLRRIPIVALGDGLAETDLVMTPPAHPAQTALRLESLVRAAVSAEEFELRRATFDENDV